MKLSKKAQRLLDYLVEYEEQHEDEQPTIGEICKGCKTTPKTLLTKTYPELEKYAEYVFPMLGDLSDENEM